MFGTWRNVLNYSEKVGGSKGWVAAGEEKGE